MSAHHPFKCYPEGRPEDRKVVVLDDEDDCPACLYMNVYQEPSDEPMVVVVENQKGQTARFTCELIDTGLGQGCLCCQLTSFQYVQ